MHTSAIRTESQSTSVSGGCSWMRHTLGHFYLFWQSVFLYQLHLHMGLEVTGCQRSEWTEGRREQKGTKDNNLKFIFIFLTKNLPKLMRFMYIEMRNVMLCSKLSPFEESWQYLWQRATVNNNSVYTRSMCGPHRRGDSEPIYIYKTIVEFLPVKSDYLHSQ